MANFEFIGFDGASYSFPPLPDSFNNYNHFYIQKYGNSYTIYCFKKKIEFNMDYSSQYGQYIFDDSANILVLKFKEGDNSFTEEIKGGTSFMFYKGNSYNIIYTCEDLAPYYTKLYKESFVLEFAEETNSFILVPILQGQENMYMRVFDEVFGVLPVLMVVLIGFIGIRKGISWLFSFLCRS